jgi:cell division protein FtsQ
MKWKTYTGVGITLSLLIAYLVVSTGFADIKQQDLVCHELRVTVCDSPANDFIQPADVEALLAAEGIKTVGEQIYSINTYAITQLLNTRTVIKDATVFASVDGVLHVNVYQRRPIMRVQSAARSFYIDESGYIFPLSGAPSIYAPVMTGNVPTDIPAGFRGEIPEHETFLQQTYRLALFVDKNSFWKSQVTQLDVAGAASVRMIPREGNHVIQMGSLENYQYKFKKLKAFYTKVCPADDSIYEHVDLRYGNQVVCTKRK